MLLILLALVPFFLLVGALLIWKRWILRESRRDPVNFKILRGAGEGIRERINGHAEEFSAVLAAAMMIGPMAMLAWAVAWMERSGFDWKTYHFRWWDLVFVAIAGWALISSFRTMTRHAFAARKYREGLAAELAVAQCLNQVVAEGGMVFHDFPADGFNIDHIVIGHSVVFAIETKSRLKPAAPGKESARVVYDGHQLGFPDHVETKPLEQATRQADWLRKFLASGVGEPIVVVPYVALPGWFVETKVPRPNVLVGNPRNPLFMMRAGFGTPLADTLRRRIAHVISERYPANSD